MSGALYLDCPKCASSLSYPSNAQWIRCASCRTVTNPRAPQQTNCTHCDTRIIYPPHSVYIRCPKCYTTMHIRDQTYQQTLLQRQSGHYYTPFQRLPPMMGDFPTEESQSIVMHHLQHTLSSAHSQSNSVSAPTSVVPSAWRESSNDDTPAHTPIPQLFPPEIRSETIAKSRAKAMGIDVDSKDGSGVNSVDIGRYTLDNSKLTRNIYTTLNIHRHLQQQKLSSNQMTVTKKSNDDSDGKIEIRNAFIVFSREKKAELRLDNPQLSEVELSIEIAQKWKNISANQRKRYIDKCKREIEVSNSECKSSEMDNTESTPSDLGFSLETMSRTVNALCSKFDETSHSDMEDVTMTEAHPTGVGNKISL